MKIAKAALAAAFAAFAGCGERESAQSASGGDAACAPTVACGMAGVRHEDPLESAIDRLAARPEGAIAILEIRKSGDTNEYLRTARDFLSAHRDDIIAADVLAIYALRRDAESFRSFALSYANGNPANLLETAEIAANESWTGMGAEFAQLAAECDCATYAQLFRAAQLIADAPDAHFDASLLERLENMAQKRYEREDVALLRCLLAFRREGLSREDADRLEDLVRNAMMPQVRKRAAQLLDARNLFE